MTNDWKVSKFLPNAATRLERVDVWRISLQPKIYDESALERLLVPDELARANRFHFERDRRRFVVCRSTLRTILANHLNARAEDLRFRYEEFGRPELAGIAAENLLSFNVAHSGEIGLIAVSRTRKIGVDVEQLRENLDCVEIAESHFSATEREELRQLNAYRQRAAFFACWTRKEALLKAMGVGLSYPLADFSVTIDPDEAPKLRDVRSQPEAVKRWNLVDLRPGDGYFGTLVYEGPECKIDKWEWNGQI